jgi:RNA-splicing ligase RtcB
MTAMACAANYAWNNRQILLHRCRETFEEVLRISPRALNMRLVYDVCHNIAKKKNTWWRAKRARCASIAKAPRALSDRVTRISVPIIVRSVSRS